MKNKLLCIALPLLALTGLNADDYYMTPDGANNQDGSNWANALPKSALATTLNTTMGPGDTLHVGSGDYGNITFTLDSDGTAGSPKTIRGVDTGSGLPHFSGDPTWTRSDPDNGRWQIIIVKGDHWVVENLELSHVRYAIRNTNVDSASNVTFRNLLIHNVRHGVFLNYVDNAVFENITVEHYTKHAFRLDRGCDNVTFIDCLADLTKGDTSWWDHAEGYPFGFIVNDGGTANSNIVFDGCVAMDNRKNNQTDYWNGDGWVIQGNTGGTTQFIDCIAVNNEDGGFDVKAPATFVNCVSVANYRGFRLWGNPKTLENCVAIFPYRRSTENPVGAEAGVGVWTQNGHSTLSNFTFHANAGTADVSFGNTPFYYINDTPTYPAPLADDSKMMRSTRAVSNSSATAATFSDIPYAAYDVYVYWGGHSTGRPVPAEMAVSLQSYNGSSWVTVDTRYMLDTDNQWDGEYNESTATSTGVAVDGQEYVVFRNVTLDSIKILGDCARRTGFNAFQIVEK